MGHASMEKKKKWSPMSRRNDVVDFYEDFQHKLHLGTHSFLLLTFMAFKSKHNGHLSCEN